MQVGAAESPPPRGHPQRELALAGRARRPAQQGSLQLSADGRYLLAADAGSNQISVLRIKPDGALTEAEGSPVWSGGNEPVSIGTPLAAAMNFEAQRG